MGLLRSTVLVFSFFSRIPMPRLEWREENLRYTTGLFPLLGAVIALFLQGWLWLCARLSLGSIIFAAGLTVLPVLVTGGIHLDGFCDTVDALSSRAEKDKRKSILSDPHIGAFAVISLCSYFLIYFALCSEVSQTAATVLAIGLIHVLSRCLVSFGILYFPSANQEGLFYFLKQSSVKNTSAVLLSIFFIATSLVLFMLLGWTFVFVILAAALYLIFIYFKFTRDFGGMSGDLAGFWLQSVEIILLAVLLVIEKVRI